jgi:hypothetical protein
VALVRVGLPPARFCACPRCGAAARVLAGSGAARPFCWCAWCGVCSPAPAAARWAADADEVIAQLALL